MRKNECKKAHLDRIQMSFERERKCEVLFNMID